MQIVIDIDEDTYKDIKRGKIYTSVRDVPQESVVAIANGTPMAEQKAILDKIIAEIWEEAEWAYADFDDYKEAVLEAEPDELPDDEFRYGLHRAVEIINKYKAETKIEQGLNYSDQDTMMPAT